MSDVKIIDNDLDRTGYLIELNNNGSFDQSYKERIRQALRNILVTFAAFNQSVNSNTDEISQSKKRSNGLGYTQGLIKKITKLRINS